MSAKDRRGRRVFVAASLVAMLLVCKPSVRAADSLSGPGGPKSAHSTVAIDAEGTLEILHEDFNNTARYLYFLKTSDGYRVPLHFAKHPPTHLLTGDHVRVHGRPSGSSLILASGRSVTNLSKTQPPPPSTVLPNTLGAQSTLVILVNFDDAPNNQPYTVADAQNLVFGAVSNFILENSYQQTWLTGQVVGWYTIPLSSTTCSISNIASYAQAAATAAGVNLSAYTRFIYAFPTNNACGFAGASNVGGNPSQSWINGTVNGLSPGTLDLHTVAHELGHAFGLWHSHLLDCGTAATICTNGTLWEYGDILDVMGAPQPPVPHYNAFQKERLGWLNYGASPAITTVQADGTYMINSYEESNGSAPNALKILKSIDATTGAKTWYYVEARQALGFDAFLTNGTCSSCYTQNETNGVLVHIGTDGNGSSGYLLDMTPATPTYYFWFDPSLVVGQSFADPDAGVVLTTSSLTSAGTVVNVQFTGGVTVATNQQTYSPGQTVSTTATATYAGSPVANVSVSFSITKANGNVVTGSTTTGKNGTAVYKLRLTSSDPAGVYIASGTTTIHGNPHSASIRFNVQ